MPPSSSTKLRRFVVGFWIVNLTGCPVGGGRLVLGEFIRKGGLLTARR